jgi:hypothetical protein
MKRDSVTLREEAKNRQKVLRLEMKELFQQLGQAIKPPLDPNEKTKVLFQV